MARFVGDAASVDERVERLRSVIAAGELPPEVTAGKLLLLVDRDSGTMLGITRFESEEALRRGDQAMNAGPGRAGSRTAVEFYEVPVHTL